jgi:putative metal-binding protein
MQRRVVGLGLACALGAASLGSCSDAPAPAERPGRVQQAVSGVCDANPPTSTQACIDAVQNNGGAVINDVFTDSNGHTATQLPVFALLYDNWPGCTTNSICSQHSLAPYDCPGSFVCDGAVPPTFQNAQVFTGAPDFYAWNPCRLAAHTLVNGCPQWGNCVVDGDNSGYLPWEGLVFDLGGPSNKVAIFATNDHGPQPCESLEYTVYLSDNPLSQEMIVDPAGTGVDPAKWNRAVLTTVYTKGWTDIRPPDPVGHAACGDTSLYAVEADSFAQVFSLPCGITFRYAAIISGNDGLDFPECAFDSFDAELDAVAGLTEDGAGVCPDADGDLYLDCNCSGAPPVCDCDDSDPAVHPGAPEPCDAGDLNCDMLPGSCPPGLVCHDSICLPTCIDESASCPPGSGCDQTNDGLLCVPTDCSQSMCPPGSVCEDGICVPACTNVVCPGTQVCKDGQCLDPCQGVDCPPPLVCQSAQCVAPCACYDGDVGCIGLPGTVCDKGNTDLCVPPICQGVVCGPTETCDPQTGLCLPFCHPAVNCPEGQKCVDPDGCVPLCDDVVCDDGFECDPDTGLCVDTSCKDVVCVDGTCVDGECVSGSGGAGGSGAQSSSSAGGSAALPTQQIEMRDGCGCRTGPDTARGWLAAALLLGMLRVRGGRRRDRSRRRW